MKKLLSFSITCFLFSCSCNNKEETILIEKDGQVIIQKPYLWWNNGTYNHISELWDCSLFNTNVIKEIREKNTSYLASINGVNGIVNWKWNDYEKNDFESMGDPYQFNNFYIEKVANRTYCIDLLSGKTNWKIIRNTSGNWISSGFGDNYLEIMFGNLKQHGFPLQAIFIGKVNSSTFYKEINPKYPEYQSLTVNNEAGLCGRPNGLTFNGHELIFVPYYSPNSIYNGKRFISLFDLTDNIWIYDSVLISKESIGQGLSLKPLFFNNCVIFNIDKSIYKCDLLTGKIIWEKQFNLSSGFGFGGFIIENNTIFCAAETDGYYALDAETGDIKWKGERSPGTSSRMAILNGVLYYINGADARLWALDAATGKTLWRLKSPDNFGFKREINVMPGDGIRKGYVLTSTWHGACAYEAER